MITPSTLDKLVTESNILVFGKSEFAENERCDTSKYIEWLEVLSTKINEFQKSTRKKPGPRKKDKPVKETPATPTIDFKPYWDKWLKRDSELYVPALRSFKLNVRPELIDDFSKAIDNYIKVQEAKEHKDLNQSQYRLSMAKFATQWADWLDVETPVQANFDGESF